MLNSLSNRVTYFSSYISVCIFLCLFMADTPSTFAKPVNTTDKMYYSEQGLTDIDYQRVATEGDTCLFFRANRPYIVNTALVVGDSLFNSDSRFKFAFEEMLAERDIALSSLEYSYVVPGQGIDDLLALLESGVLNADLADAELFVLNLGVNNWSEAESNIMQVKSWIDQAISLVLSANPNITVGWVEPHAVESLVANQRIYTGTSLVASYLNEKDANGDICLLDWSTYADSNPEVYSTATADIDGVHMFGNEAEYVNFIIDNIDAYILAEPTVPPVLGDSNCDSTVDVVDALVVLQYVVAMRTGTNSCPLNNSATEMNVTISDVNQDGEISAVDALFILQCTVNLTNVLCNE